MSRAQHPNLLFFCSQINKVILEIKAQDNGHPARSSTVTMTITINTQLVNQYPQWIEDYSAMPILLNETIHINYYVVAILKATSSVPGATMRYLIQPSQSPEQNGYPRSFYHTINSATNEMMLRVFSPLDYESIPRYTLTIRALVSFICLQYCNE